MLPSRRRRAARAFGARLGAAFGFWNQPLLSASGSVVALCCFEISIFLLVYGFCVGSLSRVHRRLRCGEELSKRPGSRTRKEETTSAARGVAIY